MGVLQGLDLNGLPVCISSRTLSDVSHQCGLRHNRFTLPGVALEQASRLIYHPDNSWGYN